uniref:Uncharacterized protein n=1 Tax=Timema tahoe TaxID=61484 RepID=A0A7R9IEQ1_9NEOP|nr:unnamed protein product [Timema tahoe]
MEKVICLVAFDVRLDSFNQNSEQSSRLIDAALSINSSILRTDNGLQLWKWFDTPLYRKLKRSHLVLEQVAVELVTKKIEILKLQNLNKTSHQPSLLELYLSSQHLDHKDVIGMSVDMILAGIDTDSEELSTECLELYNIKDVSKHSVPDTKRQPTMPAIKLSLRINGMFHTMEVDTGAALTIISEETYKVLWPHQPKLESLDLDLRTLAADTPL